MMYFDPNASPLAGQCGYDQAECDAVRAENERLQYALDDIGWGGTHMDVRATMQNALDAARAALDRVRALCDEADRNQPPHGFNLRHTDVRAALDGGRET